MMANIRSAITGLCNVFKPLKERSEQIEHYVFCLYRLAPDGFEDDFGLHIGRSLLR
jgi:hypothetical protein